MIYYEIKSKNGRVLSSNFKTCSVETINLVRGHEKENGWLDKNVRLAFRENETTEIRLIIIGDADLGKSSKNISRICDAYLGFVYQIAEIEKSQRQHFDRIITRFAHNLVDLNKDLKSDLQRLAPDSTREKNYDEFMDNVETRIKNNTRSAANDICHIAHRATDLEAQITGLRVISGLAEEIQPSYISVNIQRTISRLQQPFLSKLEGKGISISNRIDSSEADKNKVRIDPQLLNVALSQFFGNIVKYGKPNSPIEIFANFTNGQCSLVIEMESLHIESDESEKIFEEKYKGKNADNFEGNGIGMFLTRRALKIMNAEISVQPNSEILLEIGTNKYSKNIFIITLPLRTI